MDRLTNANKLLPKHIDLMAGASLFSIPPRAVIADEYSPRLISGSRHKSERRRWAEKAATSKLEENSSPAASQTIINRRQNALPSTANEQIAKSL